MVAVRYTGQPLVRGAFGIEEPCGEPFAGVPDVCVAPLLAADGQFRRLGYGGGYYDRYFAREGRGAFKIGICYDVQLIKTIPARRMNARLDVIGHGQACGCGGRRRRNKEANTFPYRMGDRRIPAQDGDAVHPEPDVRASRCLP